MTNGSRWFAARLLFESSYSNRPDEHLYEERVVLLRSDTGMEGAHKKAKKLGIASKQRYKNVEGADVAWDFKEILDLIELLDSDIGEGTEVYFHFLKAEDVEQIRETLRPGRLG